MRGLKSLFHLTLFFRNQEAYSNQVCNQVYICNNKGIGGLSQQEATVHHTKSKPLEHHNVPSNGLVFIPRTLQAIQPPLQPSAPYQATYSHTITPPPIHPQTHAPNKQINPPILMSSAPIPQAPSPKNRKKSQQKKTPTTKSQPPLHHQRWLFSTPRAALV